MKGIIILVVIKIALVIAMFVGHIMCIVKAINCNWEPIGKSEVIYTGGALIPGVGAIIGYLDIEDK